MKIFYLHLNYNKWTNSYIETSTEHDNRLPLDHVECNVEEGFCSFSENVSKQVALNILTAEMVINYKNKIARFERMIGKLEDLQEWGD